LEQPQLELRLDSVSSPAWKALAPDAAEALPQHQQQQQQLQQQELLQDMPAVSCCLRCLMSPRLL